MVNKFYNDLRDIFEQQKQYTLHELFLKMKELKKCKIEIKPLPTVIKLSLRYSSVPKCNTVYQSISQRHYPKHNTIRNQFSFFSLKVLNCNVRGDDTMKSVIFHLLSDDSSAVNKNLANVINSINCTERIQELVKSYTFLRDQ